MGLIDDYWEAIEMLRIERQCVARDCDHDCSECVLARNKDELLHAYDTAIRLLMKSKPKPRESRRKLPCPKCGNKRPSVWCMGDDSGKPMEFIACEKCKTAAEASYTTIGAIRNWNEVVRSWKA